MIFLVVALLVPVAQAETARSASLEVRRSVELEKGSGSVDQVLALPGGGFVVREYSATDPATQKLELYDRDGRRRSVIDRYGQGPGQYRRLSDLAAGRDGSLWVADFGSTRVLRYSEGGEVLQTFLVQNPSFRPRAVEVDRERGFLYLAGCYPTATYLDRGCLLLHRYTLDTGDFRGSFVETPFQVVEKRWAGRSRYDLALGASGAVYLLHEAFFGLLRLDPESGEVATLPIETTTAREPPQLSRETVISTERKQAAMGGAYRMARVEVAGSWMVVSIARPNDAGYLIVLLHEGEQVSRDVPGPGRLVGSSADGGFIFGRREEGRFVLDFAYPKLAPGAEAGSRSLRGEGL